MKKQKKIFISIIIFFSILLSSCQVFAKEYMKAEFSESFLNYLELSDEEKLNAFMPMPYDIEKTKAITKNPLRLVQMAKGSVLNRFSLKDYIPENMVIKNQMATESCWTFSSLAVLESNLALKDYKKRISTFDLNNESSEENKKVTVYDFSERHMEYATSQTFAGGVINPLGFRREVGSGGNYRFYIPYLTNGSGAIPESEMSFENNQDKIDLEEIQGKTVVTQVNDTIIYPSYESYDDKTELIQQMKEHIQNYGAIDAVIHGASLFNSTCYNNATGGLYCKHRLDANTAIHDVAIIGWNDEYPIANFKNEPSRPGAWIIKNSWGTEYDRCTLTEMKELVFQDYNNDCIANGWTEPTQVTDEFAKEKIVELGYIMEGDEAVIYKGDKGFMYVSYEDYNIYLQLSGIIDAETINYENIYQYNEFGSNIKWGDYVDKMYIASVFNKKTDGKEYLTQVSINAPETYTCKVYVNPDGTEKSSIEDLVPVQLEGGETETFDAGYHTIKFAEPVKIESDNFLVVLEIQGTREGIIEASFEVNKKISSGKSTIWDNVTISQGTCFVSFGDTFSNKTWLMTSNLQELTGGNMINADTTLKAFTTSKVLETISVVNSAKSKYVEGQDFDTTGLKINANYANGDIIDVTEDITILNGEDLKIGQTEVTFIYEGKSTKQTVEVVKNTVESIEVKNAPENDEYWAGEKFDVTGMSIDAIYRDGTRKMVQVTESMIKDGQVLKNSQETITVEYEGKAVTQKITVKNNPVVELIMTKEPKKDKYIVGQDFDCDGIILVAKYAKGNEATVIDYEVTNGTNLQSEQTSVTLRYEGVQTTYPITVEEKSVTGIAIENMPKKTEYIQNKENLDLTEGKIKISYNDKTTEVMSMTSKDITVTGFDNTVAGKQTLTLTYKGYSISFEIEIKELAKPVNSDFTKVQGIVKSIKGYSFSDTTKEPYMVVNVELSNIKKAVGNDTIEYYYYLSANNAENNIANWVKTDSLIDENGKFALEINTLEVSNFNDIVDADNLYLYIREVATRNDMVSELVTNANILEAENINIEEYVDGEKKVEINSEEIVNPTPGEPLDNSLAQDIIPNAGEKLLLIFLILIICALGRVAYLKYKDIEI